MSRSEFSIRHHCLSEVGEWQVLQGRKVVYRCDLEQQAVTWLDKEKARSPATTSADAPIEEEKAEATYPDDARRFSEALRRLGFKQAAFIRWLQENGDARTTSALQRQIGRLYRGERQVSGEMWVLLGLLERNKASWPRND